MSKLLFVKKILQKAEHYDWTIQGFGMLRLYMSPEVRLHVWDPARAFPGVSTIHTHPWDFKSDILVGSLTDRLYVDWIGNGAAATHSRQQIACGAGACTTGEATNASLRVQHEITYCPGSGYSMRADEIHESFPARGCVSLITRRFKADTEHADVFFPLNTTWKSSEPRKATPDEIRSMCDNALMLM